MANLFQRLQAAASAFVKREPANPGPPGGFSLGTSLVGGPLTTDAWGSKRAPSPVELVEHFKSIAYNCAVINANAVSAVPLKLYMDSSRGKKPKDISNPRGITPSEHRSLAITRQLPNSSASVADVRELRNHRFLYTLNHPDPYGLFDLAYILKYISTCNDIIGRAYFYPNRDINGQFTTFYPLLSQYVFPQRTAGSILVDRYQYFAENFEPDEIVYFDGNVSLRDPYAASFPPLYAAIEYAKLEDKFVSVQEQLMAMGPRPNMIASPKDSTNPPGRDEKDRFEQDLNRKHARSRQGGILVTAGAWDFQPITYSPTDLAGLKIAEYDLQHICGALGVPIEFFTSDTNLANLQAAESQHAKLAVRPRCVSIANRLTRIVQRWDESLFFAFDNPVTADEEQAAKTIDMKVKNGQMTINQANEDTGVPPAPWGEEPWFPVGTAQPSMLQKIHEATVAMSQAGAVGLAEGGGNPAVQNKDVKKDKSGAKGGKPGGKKNPDASSSKSRSLDAADLPGGGGGVPDQADASAHAIEGLTAEGEDGDPFGWLSWSVDPPSAASD